MPQLPPSNAPRSGSRRWRRAALGAAAILAAGVPIAATATSTAEATTPTSPPPVTVLTSNGDIGQGRHLHLAVRRREHVRQRSRDPRRQRQRRLVQSGPRRRGGQRLPHPDLPRPAGPHVVAGHRARRPLQRHRLHLQRPLPADRDGQRRQRAERRWPRVPDHPVEHRADPLLHDRHREPDLDRRPRRPDRDRRRRPGDRHRHGQGPVPVEQRRPRPLQPERAAAAGLAQRTVGLVPRQRRQARHRRQPPDRRPRHLDDLQGQPRHRQHHLAARRQGLELHPPGSPGTGARQRQRAVRVAARSPTGGQRRVHVLRQRVLRHPAASLQPRDHGQAGPVGRTSRRSSRPTTSPRGSQRPRRATRRRPPTAISSSAGASSRTSRSSTRWATSSSTPSSPRA